VAVTIGTAFVLGAGLGTRLRPLTEERPKPLVPLVHKPLITFAFDHLHAVGVRRFVVNTHHRPQTYDAILNGKNGRAEYRGCEVVFRHEPELLDTGGGIGNIRDLVGNEPFLVHNGDVLADLRRALATRPVPAPRPVRPVVVAGGTWVHRSDCILVRGKAVRAASAAARRDRRACPVCAADVAAAASDPARTEVARA
jgi:UTP-glucose-1-phosphate uridylyltransferase